MSDDVLAAARRALVEAALPLEVIAGQHRANPYRELSPDLIDDINRAIGIIREALDRSANPPVVVPEPGSQADVDDLNARLAVAGTTLRATSAPAFEPMDIGGPPDPDTLSEALTVFRHTPLTAHSLVRVLARHGLELRRTGDGARLTEADLFAAGTIGVRDQDSER